MRWSCPKLSATRAGLLGVWQSFVCSSDLRYSSYSCTHDYLWHTSYLLLSLFFQARGSVSFNGIRIPTMPSSTRRWAVDSPPAPPAPPAASLHPRLVLLVFPAASAFCSRLSVQATAMPKATLVSSCRLHSSAVPAVFFHSA